MRCAFRSSPWSRRACADQPALLHAFLLRGRLEIVGRRNAHRTGPAFGPALMIEQVENRSDHHKRTGQHMQLRLVAEHEKPHRDSPDQLGVLHGRDAGCRSPAQGLDHEELRRHHHETRDDDEADIAPGGSMAQEHARKARRELSRHHGGHHDCTVFLRADRAHDQDDAGADEDVHEGGQMSEGQRAMSRLHHDQNARKADQDGDRAGEPRAFAEEPGGRDRDDEGRAEGDRIDVGKRQEREGVEAGHGPDTGEKAPADQHLRISDRREPIGSVAPDDEAHHDAGDARLHGDDLEDGIAGGEQLHEGVAGRKQSVCANRQENACQLEHERIPPGRETARGESRLICLSSYRVFAASKFPECMAGKRSGSVRRRAELQHRFR